MRLGIATRAGGRPFWPPRRGRFPNTGTIHDAALWPPSRLSPGLRFGRYVVKGSCSLAPSATSLCGNPPDLHQATSRPPRRGRFPIPGTFHDVAMWPLPGDRLAASPAATS
ncbi:hypothetical protein [Brachybacterium sacelli]|uniref:hypothetical protein n=1 Tax=Brachybacterium sacelli TaxID=173364 RepID=UPI00361CEA6E